MKALILAAGYATRLYPLTKDFPKPLLKVGNKPIINYIVDKLNLIPEVDEIIVITNNKFISIFRKWAGGIKTKKRLTVVDDRTRDLDDRLGAIGDMNFAIKRKRIKDDILVIGGDNLFDDDLDKFIDFTRAKRGSPVIGVYNIKSKLHASRYGVVKLNKHNKIIDFDEKPKSPKSTLVAMCFYFFPKQRLGLIKEYFDAKSLQHDATGFYINWLKNQCAVYSFIFKGKWYDIGHRKFYDEANIKFANKHRNQ